MSQGPYSFPPIETIDAIHFVTCPIPVVEKFQSAPPAKPYKQATLPLLFSHHYSQAPEPGLIDEEDIPPSLRPEYDDIAPVVFDTPDGMTAKGFDNGCIAWALATSADGLITGRRLHSFGYDADQEKDHMMISYASAFESFWRDTLAASCDWPDAPHCGSPPIVSSLQIAGDPSFTCGGGSGQLTASAVMSSSMPGHVSSLTKCEPAGCGSTNIDIPVTWELTQPAGGGWSIASAGDNTVTVTPPPCGCAVCPDALLSATTIPGYGAPQSAQVTLTVTGCGVSAITITGPSQTDCTGTYQYTAQDQLGRDIQVTWSAIGGGTIDGNGVLTPPATNPNCASNSVITADWVCPGDPSVTATQSLGVAHNCAGTGVTAYNDQVVCSCCISGGTCRCYLYAPSDPCQGCGSLAGWADSYDCAGNSIGKVLTTHIYHNAGPLCNTSPCWSTDPNCTQYTGQPVRWDERTSAMKTNGCCPEGF